MTAPRSSPSRTPPGGAGANASRKTIQSVSRALDLLEALALHEEVGLVDLATQAGLLPSTTHRILATLSARKYVVQNPETGRYALGYKFLELAGSAQLSLSFLRSVARPHLEALCRAVGETTKLVVLDGDSIVYIDKVDSDRSVRGFARIGQSLPAHVAASGKAILAYEADDVVATIVGASDFGKKLTANTISSPSAFRRELDRIRQRGYSVDLEEHEVGVVCVAAPILDHAGTAVGALSMSGPSERMRSRGPDAIGGLIASHARQVSQELGSGSGVDDRGEAERRPTRRPAAVEPA